MTIIVGSSFPHFLHFNYLYKTIFLHFLRFPSPHFLFIIMSLRTLTYPILFSPIFVQDNKCVWCGVLWFGTTVYDQCLVGKPVIKCQSVIFYSSIICLKNPFIPYLITISSYAARDTFHGLSGSLELKTINLRYKMNGLFLKARIILLPPSLELVNNVNLPGHVGQKVVVI